MLWTKKKDIYKSNNFEIHKLNSGRFMVSVTLTDKSWKILSELCGCQDLKEAKKLASDWEAVNVI